MDIRKRVEPLVRHLPLKNGTTLDAVESETVVFLCQRLCQEVIEYMELGTTKEIEAMKEEINNIKEKEDAL